MDPLCKRASVLDRIIVPAQMLLVVLLSGCASPKFNYSPAVVDISKPPLDSVNVANVGENMLVQGQYIQQDAIKVTTPIKFAPFNVYTIMPGYYVKVGSDSNRSYYIPAEGRDGGTVVKAPIADPWQSIAVEQDGSEISVITVFNVKKSKEAEGVEFTSYDTLAKDSFQQTLIYSGKFGEKIRVGYREFNANIARPSFNNDVEYDLGESSVVGYKGARIEILEATNEFIRYRVIQNFNNAVR